VEDTARDPIGQLRTAAICCNGPVISLPLKTNRLTVEMMRRQHAASLAEYRSHPEVARFQDWETPFTIEMADRLIDGQSQLDGPANEDWVQLAVVVGARSIGDVAVGIHDNGQQATIGYSITPTEQGKGYATEAVGAVISALFTEAHLHRISAGIDPANTASRRLLEKLGFRYEGRSVQSVFVRGQWVDDDRFAMLAVEYAGQLTPGDDRR
jgi:RimJ/RimL family protein N-acetyltransferase